MNFLTGVIIKPRILLVDDNRNFIESVIKFLKLDASLEYCGKASNGEEAITLIAKVKPDIVLMDLQMPGIDGIEATRIIKRTNPSIKIIIATLHEDKEYINLALSVGADGYIPKSNFVNEFHNIINNILV